MDKRFKLVNPIIGGSFQSEYNTSGPDEAARQFWTTFNEYVNGNVPQFFFTLKDVDTNEYYSYRINEKPIDRRTVKLTIRRVDNDVSDDLKRIIDEDIVETNKLAQQCGGAFKSDDEDDEDQMGGGRRRYKKYEDIKALSETGLLEPTFSDSPVNLFTRDLSGFGALGDLTDLTRRRRLFDDSSSESGSFGSSSSSNSDSASDSDSDFDDDDTDIKLNNYLRKMRTQKGIDYIMYRPYSHDKVKTQFFPTLKSGLTPYIQLKLDTPVYIR